MTLRSGSSALMLMLAAVLSGTGCDRETRDTDIKLVSVGEAKSLWDKSRKGQDHTVLFVDPRPAKTFSAGHIPGARNLTLPRIDLKRDRDPTIERYDNIVVYGDDPGSATARGMTKRLLAAGYSNIRLFAGGLKDWVARTYPVDTAPSTAPAAPTAPPAGEPR